MAVIRLSSGEKVNVVLPKIQAERLSRTCFRGQMFRLAGNFFAWPYFSDFISDPIVKGKLAENFWSIIQQGNVNKDYRITLTFEGPVGWASTIKSEKLLEFQLNYGESKQLNAKATACFLPIGIIKAPKTNQVTLVLTMAYTDHWTFFVQTIYPGVDVGRMQGDMTAKIGMVWLSWSNPGE